MLSRKRLPQVSERRKADNHEPTALAPDRGQLMTRNADYGRCSWCGRKGTLTSLSAGNRCELQDDCERARLEALAQAAHIHSSESR